MNLSPACSWYNSGCCLVSCGMTRGPPDSLGPSLFQKLYSRAKQGNGIESHQDTETKTSHGREVLSRPLLGALCPGTAEAPCALCHSPRCGWCARTDRKRSRQGAAPGPTPPGTSERLLCTRGRPARPSETQLSVPCSGQGHVKSPGVIQKSNALVLIGPHTGEDDKVLLTPLERVHTGNLHLLQGQ